MTGDLRVPGQMGMAGMGPMGMGPGVMGPGMVPHCISSPVVNGRPDFVPHMAQPAIAMGPHAQQVGSLLAQTMTGSCMLTWTLEDRPPAFLTHPAGWGPKQPDLCQLRWCWLLLSLVLPIGAECPPCLLRPSLNYICEGPCRHALVLTGSVATLPPAGMLP